MTYPDYLRHTGPSQGVLPPRSEPRGLPVLDLSGAWEFHWAADHLDVPEGFEHGRGVAPATIPVPSHWQLQGYGSPQYTNAEYPFPVDVPHPPADNPVGSYRRTFPLPAGWAGGRVLLRFAGVDSTAKVWLNGVELGLLVGSRLTHEFDVTPYVRPGENLVAVRVHQWSAASYLEDQDMWWLSGIFREVGLCLLPEGVPSDVRITAEHGPGGAALTVHSDLPGRFEIPELGLSGPTGERVAAPGAQLWSAESPRLYEARVYGRTPRSVGVRVGFRTVSAEDGVFRVNGRRTVLRGVNRHDFHPERGRAVTREDMLADVLLIKRAGFNALRTAHYPPHPYLLDLCDEHGLYVIDECDLETHGFFDHGWEGNPADDPRWTEAMLARMRSMVVRDHNHPSVVMWSLGNESGTGRNLAAMAAWTRTADPSRPIHYESDQETAYTDIWSQMYPSHDHLAAVVERREPPLDDPGLDAARRAKPYLLCEYGHAMGNGPGGLLEYRDLMESSERCAGGFVWELIDHGLTTSDPDGNTVTGYGGDFGEPLHAGNFCCDGLLFADRTPSPALLEAAAVNAPVRLRPEAGSVTVTSAYDHIGTGHLDYGWSLLADGVEVASGPLDVPDLEPGGRTTVPLPAAAFAPHDGELVLTVTARLAKSTSWAPRGHEIAWAQRVVATPPAPVRPATDAAPARSGRTITLGPATFDAGSGLLASLSGLPIAGPRLELWRAPTDNDLRSRDGEPVAAAWERLGLHRLTHRLVELALSGDAVTAVVRTAAAHRTESVLTTYRWTSSGDVLSAAVSIEPCGDWSVPVARIGLTLELPAGTGPVTWYGYGPGEAYPDSRSAVRIGRYESTVEAMHTPYARPQENGHRMDVRRAAVGPLRIGGDRPFGLTVTPYGLRRLSTTRHHAALREEDRLYCLIDLAQHGLGSSSCGPLPLPHHTLLLTPRTFTLNLTCDDRRGAP
ncbi:glycoside hydrolase family 2 TIM barrel-domain containing protein [Nonomuraea wenchangensis]|uniref:glycoside hydrolase family 2 TIM barrel-domain containing protein n=1 Tax=Nonomuraea wenchangensis TaxID=568860 RepID=UPI003716C6A8